MENNSDLTESLNTISEVTNQYFPRKISIKQYEIANNPCFIPNILKAIKSKDKLYAKYLNERSSTSYSNYEKGRNKLSQIKIRLGKRSISTNFFKKTSQQQ